MGKRNNLDLTSVDFHIVSTDGCRATLQVIDVAKFSNGLGVYDGAGNEGHVVHIDGTTVVIEWD